MNSREFCSIARRLMSHPASPYHEHSVRDEVERLCATYGLDARRDEFGNVLVRYQSRPTNRPLVLAAHMDHPGFEIVRRLDGRRWRARFLGGVPDVYFRRGIKVRLMPTGAVAVVDRGTVKKREFDLRAPKPVPGEARFAVWELEDFAVRNGRIHGRACDDLIGVAVILATLIKLKRSRARANVIGVISRAEEVGFVGALAVASTRFLPKASLVISLETSRELPGAAMGQGVILRVGDKASVFDSDAMRFLSEIAARLAAKDRRFRFQRALMSGGTCEATAYQEFGFQTGAVCVALGNYHNCGPQNRIAPEFVDMNDALGMVNLLSLTARELPSYNRLVAKLPARLRKLLRGAARLRRE